MLPVAKQRSKTMSWTSKGRSSRRKPLVWARTGEELLGLGGIAMKRYWVESYLKQIWLKKIFQRCGRQ